MNPEVDEVPISIETRVVEKPGTDPLDRVIEDLTEKLEILKLKVEKLEMIAGIKDDKVRRLEKHLAEAGLRVEM